MSKIIFVIGSILLVNCASCQSEHGNLKLFVILNDCVLSMEFENLTSKEQFIPNYSSIAKDTIQGMIVMPLEVARIDNDTLVLSSSHLRNFEGSKDTLRNYDLTVSHGENMRVVIISNTVVLKKRNKQTLLLPSVFCGKKLSYCTVYMDGDLLAKSKIAND